MCSVLGQLGSKAIYEVKNDGCKPLTLEVIREKSSSNHLYKTRKRHVNPCNPKQSNVKFYSRFQG